MENFGNIFFRSEDAVGRRLDPLPASIDCLERKHARSTRSKRWSTLASKINFRPD
jgi:hypothetical protein